jgi:tRNA pseudouridine55 synthase
MVQRRGARPAWRDIHGLLLLDKPTGISSSQALQSARRLLRAAKGGHTGALDPLATGLLPLCFGEATKIAGLLLGSAKAYRTVAKLGVVTDTDDADGSVLIEQPVPALDRATVESALGAFVGRIQQRPPIYSALKRGGEPLYAKARRGEQVEVEAREVEVQAIQLLDLQDDRLTLEIACGSGTYIRSLVRDLGESLGCGAHVEQLRRLWVEPFRAPSMIDLETLERLAAEGDAALLQVLLPLEAALPDWRRVPLDESQELRLRQGQRIGISEAPGEVLAVNEHGEAIGLAEVGDDSMLFPRRLFLSSRTGEKRST